MHTIKRKPVFLKTPRNHMHTQMQYLFLLLSVLMTFSVTANNTPIWQNSDGSPVIYSYEELMQLTADDAATSNMFFALSVASDDGVVVVGARNRDPNSFDNGLGSVYVFTKNNNNSYSQTQKLTADNGDVGNAFGYAVAIENGVIVVGANNIVVGDNNDAEASAYVFTADNGGFFRQTQKLVAAGRISGNFGSAVAIESDVIVVGAFANFAGSAHVFNADSNGSFSQTQKLSGDRDDNGFGRVVDIDNGTIVVGAARVANSVGSVYVFTTTIDGLYSQSQKIKINDNQSGPEDAFGTAVAIENDVIVVGAPKEEQSSGSVYIYTKNIEGLYSQAQRINAVAPVVTGQFGLAVALDAGVIVIGANRDPTHNAGSAYVFTADIDGLYGPAHKLNAAFGASGDSFSAAVAMDSGVVFIAAPAGLTLPNEAYVSNFALTSEKISVVENTAITEGLYTALDIDGDSLIFSLSGVDADDFRVDAQGQLSFITEPDFETPTDSDMNNAYDVTITVSDSNLSSDLMLTVTVTDIPHGDANDTDLDGIEDVFDGDDDNDGVQDTIEREQGSDPLNANDYLDTDSDGVPDYIELLQLTDANDTTSYLDTDGDGVSDYIEILQGTAGNVLPNTPGLPFTEDFSSQVLMDSSQTMANWSTKEKSVALAWRKAQVRQQVVPFDIANAGIDISSDINSTSSLAVGDVDNDGELDVVVGNTGRQFSRLYLNDGSGAFSSGVPIGDNSDSDNILILGDVDGDGDLDVLTSGGGLNKFYLNNGVNAEGVFQGFANGMDFGIATTGAPNKSISSLALGDVDGDGDLDVLASMNSTTNKLYRNNGTATDGTFYGFSSAEDIGSDRDNTRALGIGDVDSDGDLDVMSVNSGQTNKLYLNNGSGVFVSSLAIGSDRDNTWALALGDVDNDGDLDVIFASNMETNNLTLYLNNGRGVFGSSLAIGSDVGDTHTIALGDVNGDGYLDLISSNSKQTNKLYQNNGTALDGIFNGFSSAQDIGIDIDDTRSVTLCDIDRDGDLDLLTGNIGQTNKLYINNNSGVSATSFNLNSLAISSGQDLNTLTLGDVDNDGDLDVLASNAPGSSRSGINLFYLNNGTASNGTFRGFTGPFPISDDIDTTLSLTLGDMDGDGYLDVMALNNSGNSTKLYLNKGNINGAFQGFTRTIDFRPGNHHAVALGDMDNDGDLDVMIASAGGGSTNKLYFNNGVTSNGIFKGFAEPVVIDSDNNTSVSVVLGDVDNDGDLDLVTGTNGETNKLYMNDGVAPDGTFRGFAIGLDIGSDMDRTDSITLGDVDGDGDLDLVAGNYGQSNKFYLNNGITDNGTFGGFASSIAINRGNGTTGSVELGDIDNDGDLDLVAGNNFGLGGGSGEYSNLYLNEGVANNGTFRGFSFAATLGDGGRYGVWSVTMGDVDNDGDLDIVEARKGYGDADFNTLYLNDANNSFNVTSLSIDRASDVTHSLAIGDMDGDGDLDVLAGNAWQTNKLCMSNGANWFDSASSGFADCVAIGSDADDTVSLTIGDVDNDGDLDVLAGNNGQTNKLYLNNGNSYDGTFRGFASALEIDSNADNTLTLALGDVDGDGDLDVITGNEGQTNKLYLNNGTASDGTFRSFAGSLGISSDTDLTFALALGDVDGDGDLDVISGNNGETNKLFLNNGRASNGTFRGFANGVDIASEADNTRSLILGDVDRDGDLDIMAGNYGEPNKLYLNNGTSFDGTFSGFNHSIAIGSDNDNTTSLTLGDADGDGDLDFLTGNDGQTNKRYLNETASSGGTFTGFASGVDIGSEQDNTHSLIIADVDNDGRLDLLVGNGSQINKFYSMVSYKTHAGQVVSSKINDTETNLLSVRLVATQSINTASTRNTEIDYYLSNNGGNQWHLVKSGVAFNFPDTGTDDLRWKAQLKSLSPSITPLLSEIIITQIIDTDSDGFPDECDTACLTSGGVADDDDDNDGVLDINDTYPLIPIGDLLDTDNDGAPNECDEACIALGMAADSETVPQAPVITSVVIEDGILLVSFSPNDDGGYSIIDYTLSCGDVNGTINATRAQSPILISEVENDTTYTCFVTARNLLGNSTASKRFSISSEEAIRSGLNIPLLKAILDAQSTSQ